MTEYVKVDDDAYCTQHDVMTAAFLGQALRQIGDDQFLLTAKSQRRGVEYILPELVDRYTFRLSSAVKERKRVYGTYEDELWPETSDEVGSLTSRSSVFASIEAMEDIMREFEYRVDWPVNRYECVQRTFEAAKGAWDQLTAGIDTDQIADVVWAEFCDTLKTDVLRYTQAGVISALTTADMEAKGEIPYYDIQVIRTLPSLIRVDEADLSAPPPSVASTRNDTELAQEAEPEAEPQAVVERGEDESCLSQTLRRVWHGSVGLP